MGFARVLWAHACTLGEVTEPKAVNQLVIQTTQDARRDPHSKKPIHPPAGPLLVPRQAPLTPSWECVFTALNDCVCLSTSFPQERKNRGNHYSIIPLTKYQSPENIMVPLSP